MNTEQKDRIRAHAHGVIAADMASDGHIKWARFHERKMRQIQTAMPRNAETDDEVRNRLRADFLNGKYEQVS